MPPAPDYETIVGQQATSFASEHIVPDGLTLGYVFAYFAYVFVGSGGHCIIKSARCVMINIVRTVGRGGFDGKWEQVLSDSFPLHTDCTSLISFRNRQSPQEGTFMHPDASKHTPMHLNLPPMHPNASQ